MSFGSDTPGGAVEGIGGREEGIGGISGGIGGGDYVGGWEAQVREGYRPGVGGMTVGETSLSDLDRAIRSMSAPEQEAFFRQQVEPTLEKAYGLPGQTMEAVTKMVVGGLLNAFAPGVGTIAGVTGVTRNIAETLTELGIRQTLSEKLGISPESVPSTFSGATGDSIVNIQNRAASMGLWEDITGESAASAATGAAGTAASYQQQAIDYLKQMGAYPLAAQQQMAQVYGLAGTPEEQQAALTGLQQTPYYTGIMGGKAAGEEAIMRQAAMTGGLRSGNVQEALYDYNAQLERQALQSALGGLSGLAGMSTYAGDIAGGMAGIGSTLASGQMQAAKAEQAGTGALLTAAAPLIKEGASWLGKTISGWF